MQLCRDAKSTVRCQLSRRPGLQHARSQISKRRMEHLWSPAVATGGNRWQMGRPRERLRQAKTVAAGCDPLPPNLDGKEGVVGSSPTEGSAKAPEIGVFAFRSTCSLSNVRWYGAVYGAFSFRTAAGSRKFRQHKPAFTHPLRQPPPRSCSRAAAAAGSSARSPREALKRAVKAAGIAPPGAESARPAPQPRQHADRPRRPAGRRAASAGIPKARHHPARLCPPVEGARGRRSQIGQQLGRLFEERKQLRAPAPTETRLALPPASTGLPPLKGGAGERVRTIPPEHGHPPRPQRQQHRHR